MGDLIRVNFPQHNQPSRRTLGDILHNPRFCKRTLPFLGGLVSSAVLIPLGIHAASEALAPEVCAIGTADHTGPGAAQRIVENAAQQAGVTRITNMYEATSAVQRQSDSLVIPGDQGYNVCFQDGVAVTHDIYPVGTFATPGPSPTPHG